jgi:hypothetical protein
VSKNKKNRKVEDSFWDSSKKENVNTTIFSVSDENIFGQKRFIILEKVLKKEKELRSDLLTERFTKKINEVASVIGKIDRNYSSQFMVVSGEVANILSKIDEQDENFNNENDIENY